MERERSALMSEMTMDRKAMVRDYKGTARPMGVYRVWNPTTGTSLVAASLDLTAILNRHRARLAHTGSSASSTIRGSPPVA